MEMANGVVGVELRPRRTGSLRWLRVRNLPDVSPWTMRSLKELVPMSMAAKREEDEAGECGRLVPISWFWIKLIVGLLTGIEMLPEGYEGSNFLLKCCNGSFIVITARNSAFFA